VKNAKKAKFCSLHNFFHSAPISKLRTFPVALVISNRTIYKNIDFCCVLINFQIPVLSVNLACTNFGVNLRPQRRTGSPFFMIALDSPALEDSFQGNFGLGWRYFFSRKIRKTEKFKNSSFSFLYNFLHF
jgi:hypothetical protein